MRPLAWIMVPIFLLSFVGCARFPENQGPSDAPPRTIYSEASFREPIDATMYYFLVLGLDQTNTTGPVPVVTDFSLGNGWSVLSPVPPGSLAQQPPYFVELSPRTGGSFQAFRLNGSGQYDALGQPYRFGYLTDAMNRRVSLYVEIDQRDLAPFLGSLASPTAQLNWITMDAIDPPLGVTKQYDGIGPTGNDYLTDIPLAISWTRESGVDGVPIEPIYGETLGGVRELTTSIASIDLLRWLVQIRLR